MAFSVRSPSTSSRRFNDINQDATVETNEQFDLSTEEVVYLKVDEKQQEENITEEKQQEENTTEEKQQEETEEVEEKRQTTDEEDKKVAFKIANKETQQTSSELDPLERLDLLEESYLRLLQKSSGIGRGTPLEITPKNKLKATSGYNSSLFTQLTEYHTSTPHSLRRTIRPEGTFKPDVEDTEEEEEDPGEEEKETVRLREKGKRSAHHSIMTGKPIYSMSFDTDMGSVNPINPSQLTNVPKFDGEVVNFDRWYQNLVNYIKLVAIPRQTWPELIRYCLTDRALIYYNSLADEIRDDVETCIQHLGQHFSPSNDSNKFAALKTKQRPLESVSQYAKRLEATFDKYRINDEDLKVHSFMEGLKAEIKDKLILMRPTEFYQAETYAQSLEANYENETLEKGLIHSLNNLSTRLDKLDSQNELQNYACNAMGRFRSENTPRSNNVFENPGQNNDRNSRFSGAFNRNNNYRPNYPNNSFRPRYGRSVNPYGPFCRSCGQRHPYGLHINNYRPNSGYGRPFSGNNNPRFQNNDRARSLPPGFQRGNNDNKDLN